MHEIRETRSSRSAHPCHGLCSFTVVVAVTLCLSAAALAEGVDVGEYRLTGGVGVGAGFDSNVFYTPTESNVEPTTGVNAFATPRFGVETIDPRAFDLDLSLTSTWTQYVSDDERERAQSGLSLGGGGSLRFNPRGDVSFMPALDVRRTNDPAYSLDGVPFRNWRIAPSAELGWHPGGTSNSRLGFSGLLRGRYVMQRFEERDVLARDVPGFSGRLQYNLLPKTALYLSGGFDRTMYVNSVGEFGDPGFRSDSSAWRARLGFSGVITRHLAFQTAAGYGQSNYDFGPSTASVLLDAGLDLDPGGGFTTGLHYRRGFTDSSIGNGLVYDALRLTAGLGIGAVEVGAGVGLRFLRLDGVESFEAIASEDTLLDGNLSLRVGLGNHVGLFTGYAVRASLSEVSDEDLAAGNFGGPAGPRGYTQHSVRGGLDVRF